MIVIHFDTIASTQKFATQFCKFIDIINDFNDFENIKQIIKINFELDCNVYKQGIETDFAICVLANSQTNGIGRVSRNWQDGFGNFFATIIIKSQDVFEYNNIFKTNPSLLGYYVSLSVFSVIKSIIDPHLNNEQTTKNLKIKWPNDIMFTDEKLCGILLQNIDGFFLIGVGINILSKPSLDTASLYKPCCILDIINTAPVATTNITNNLIAYNILTNLLQNLSSSFESLIKSYCTKVYNFKKQITVKTESKSYIGIFNSITQNGELEIIENSNKSMLITFGDVFM